MTQDGSPCAVVSMEKVHVARTGHQSDRSSQVSIHARARSAYQGLAAKKIGSTCGLLFGFAEVTTALETMRHPHLLFNRFAWSAATEFNRVHSSFFCAAVGAGPMRTRSCRDGQGYIPSFKLLHCPQRS